MSDVTTVSPSSSNCKHFWLQGTANICRAGPRSSGVMRQILLMSMTAP